METKEYLKQLLSCKTKQEFKNIWDPNKFDWNYSIFLYEKCLDYFNIWWNPNKFDWYFVEFLCVYCNQYFNKWWDPKKFDWNYVNYLQKYCDNYKHIWEKDFLKWKLKNIQNN